MTWSHSSTSSLVDVHAGVVDQDVYAAELLYRLVDQTLRLLRVRDVRLGDHRFAASPDLVDLRGYLLGRSLAAGVVDHDLRARAAQLFAYRGAYAPASSRYYRNRALQVQNGLLSGEVLPRKRSLLPPPLRTKLYARCI